MLPLLLPVFNLRCCCFLLSSFLFSSLSIPKSFLWLLFLFTRVAHLAMVTFCYFFWFASLHLLLYTRNWCIVAGSSNSKHWSLLMQLKWTMSYATNANAFESKDTDATLQSIENCKCTLYTHATSSTHIQMAFFSCSFVCIFTHA